MNEKPNSPESESFKGIDEGLWKVNLMLQTKINSCPSYASHLGHWIVNDENQ